MAHWLHNQGWCAVHFQVDSNVNQLAEKTMPSSLQTSDEAGTPGRGVHRMSLLSKVSKQRGAMGKKVKGEDLK